MPSCVWRRGVGNLVSNGGHDPTLGTIRMVENAIKRSNTYPTRKALLQSLPRQVQYQTFKRIIDYLLESRKIILNGNEIVWVFADNAKLKRALAKSIRAR
jgi:transcriptional regulator CtsR